VLPSLFRGPWLLAAGPWPLAPDPWLALAVLGAYHGLNPAMGWLFAVALGLQERRLSAVLKAVVPIAIGHELSIAVVVAVVGVAELAGLAGTLRGLGAVVLVLFGLYKLVKPRSHPRWVGMRVGPRDLVLWSFLMSGAHGAGLMLFPFLLGQLVPAHAEGVAGHALAPALPGDPSLLRDLAAVTVHTAAMLMVMAAVAALVYVKVGLNVLRRAWVNLDAVWASALILAGVLTLFT
jgi:hypothetical protein